MTTTILVGPVTQGEEILKRALELGATQEAVSAIFFGALSVDAIGEFVGIESPPEDATHVGLKAPEPVEGDTPDTWLTFEQTTTTYSTRDLTAIRFDTL